MLANVGNNGGHKWLSTTNCENLEYAQQLWSWKNFTSKLGHIKDDSVSQIIKTSLNSITHYCS